MGTYTTSAAVTLVTGGPGTGKTQVLAEHLARLLADGVQPHEVLVLAASAPAAQALGERLARVLGADAAAQAPVTTAMTVALEGLATPEARAATGGRAHRLAAFEETFFLEDMRVTGQKQRRLREMLKFLERGWSEMRDDEEGWLITGEEEGVNAFARSSLAAMGALHPAEVTAAYVRYLERDGAALERARRPWVLVDDYRALSRASQRLVRLLAARGLLVTWNPVGGLAGEEPYGYADGLAELEASAPTVERVACTVSCQAQAPAAAVRNLCAQPSLAQVPAPQVAPDAAPGGFEVLRADDLGGEMLLLAERVASLVADGVACEDVYVAAPTDAWARRACAALEGAGVPASRVEGRQAVGGDIRDIASCGAAVAYTALHLAADPSSATAWRCWCGFGDYLGCSASMTALGRLAEQTGAAVPELLAALDAGELTCEAVGQAKVLERYRAGRALLDRAAGLAGRALLAELCDAALGSPQMPDALAGLLGAVDADDTAADLYARAEAALVAPVFAPGTVRVGTFDAALGQAPRVLVCCGMANGLVPRSDYFELTQATIDAQAKMHERLVERLAALAAKARETLVCTTFEHVGIVEAETLKLKIERVRLRDGRRVCDLAPSVCIEYLTGAKFDYVR